VDRNFLDAQSAKNHTQGRRPVRIPGAQQEGMNLSVADKMAIAALLDQLGVGALEGALGDWGA